MRVLHVNAFHWLKGGVERAMFDETRWLEAGGHSVGHFAIRDERNAPSPTAEFFAPAADYSEGGPLARQLAQLPRAIWSRPAEDAMTRLVEAWRPEIAHVHAPSRYLTPSPLASLERAGVPVVMTLHDFKPWCANRVLFARGAPCERCRGGAHWHAAATGCIHDSHAKGAVGAWEAYAHDRRGAYRAVRRWIAPSRFAGDKAVSLGAPKERVRVLGHGVEIAADADALAAAPSREAPERPFALYAGRLSAEKGVTLLPAIARAIGDTPLVVAGEGPLRGALEAARTTAPNLALVGALDTTRLVPLLARAAVVVVPSLFYETYCYAAAEAQYFGRAVVGSAIGAIPELVEHERTGLLAPPGDAGVWTTAVRRALAAPEAATWGEEGRRRVRASADPRRHVEGLLAIYREAIAAR